MFKTTILDEGIVNQETLNKLEMKRIQETINNLNSIKYVTYNEDANRADYQKTLALISKLTAQIEDSQSLIKGLTDTLDIAPGNLYIKQSLDQAQKSHKKLVKKNNDLNDKKNGLNALIA